MKMTKPQQQIYELEKFAGGSIAIVCGSAIFEGTRGTSILQQAVRDIYKLNDALRIRVTETNGEVSQEVFPYMEQPVPVLHFKSKKELDCYAENYARSPLDLYGCLCEISVVLLESHFGILVKMHHIISDAWTLVLIASQFIALVNGQTPAAYSYKEYMEKEENYLQSCRYKKDRAFYLEQYQRCEGITYLCDRPGRSFTAARKSFLIDRKKAKQITEYCAIHNTSVYTLFMTALAIYLNRIKMNREIFFLGTAILNRTGPKEKNTMGMFINTVPVLIELENENSFAGNLDRVAQSVTSALRHQRFNYSDALSALRQKYDFGGKLFDIVLSYQNAKLSDTGVTTWYSNGMQTESLQIHIDDRDSTGSFRMQYDYLVDMFSETEIDQMHQHFMNLLLDAITNDERKIYQLDLLTTVETKKLYEKFNDTATDYPRDKCVHVLFEEQAERAPDKIAVVACDRTLTYQELNEEANRIAHGLIEKGVGAGDIVAFSLPRKSYLLSTIFGILKAGAAYLPVDPDYPKDRIDYMLSESAARYYLTDDSINELLSFNSNYIPPCNINSANPCYCLFTSGTTGKPKATVITHSNLVNFTNNNVKNRFQNTVINNCSTILSVTTILFDISVFEIFLTLLNGLSLLFPGDTDIVSADKLADLIQRYSVDAIFTTPTKFSMYLRSLKFQHIIKNLKVLMIGAEAFPADLLKRLRNYTSALIFNGYGPTETTVGVLFSLLNNSVSQITIGTPIANTQVHIIDKYMNIVPIGITGELCIAGDGVGAGYLNRPDLTAEKFIDNPFGKGKLYKTGDLAYWREDGNIAYVGRNDFQVKIRGLRIELGEIENALSSVDGISQSVVIARKNDEGRQLICAFYTGTEQKPRDIRAEMSKRLPKYMLPHAFAHLDNMPLTPNGKIDRRALPEVELEVDTANYVPPKTVLEHIFCELYAEVLEAERVGINDDFFDLGGDSLKAIELLCRAQEKGLPFELQWIFEHSTVKSLLDQMRVPGDELVSTPETFEKYKVLLSKKPATTYIMNP